MVNGRAWGAIEIPNNHTYIATPPPSADAKLDQSDPLREDGLYTTQPPLVQHSLGLQVDSALANEGGSGTEDTESVQVPLSNHPEETKAGSEGEETAYESDDQASVNHSLASEELQEERAVDDLVEPITVVGLNKGQAAEISGTKTREEAAVVVTSPEVSRTASNDDSSWGPEKELAYVNDTRGNKGKKNRAGTATRRSKRHQ